MSAITLAHEIIHGIVYSLFDGKVKFEFKGRYVYTQEISRISLFRTQFLIMLRLPVTVIIMAIYVKVISIQSINIC